MTEPLRVTEWVDWFTEAPEADAYDPEVYTAVREAILRDNIRRGGFWHQYHGGTPLLNDGRKVCFGMRAWGQLMAETLGLDDTDGRAYCAYAWMEPMPDEEAKTDD